jgi:tetratricopeptide (TPR) repeat protein
MNNNVLKFFVALVVLGSFNCAYSYDIKGVSPVNPLDSASKKYNKELSMPAFELKRAKLTKNAIKNEYAIAMDKFIKSNVRASYSDFKVLIDSVSPNDYVYMRLAHEMASLGFFNLAELAMSKIEDNELCSYLDDDVKRFYFPSSNLTQKDQLYLAELYSNIMYNDQSKEATAELSKQTTLLMESDYANYIIALGSLKNGNIEDAINYINKAIDKNSKNLNYKKLKAEILAQNGNQKEALNILKDINNSNLKTVVFDEDIHSSREYILYKTSKNDYLKKYHLAHYYYDKNELAKSLGVLQTSISGKKNLNKDVYALTSRVYFGMKEYEKAQDYAQKALDIDKTDNSALIVMGDVAYRNKDYNEALKYYKRAQAKDNNYNASLKSAQAYLSLNQINKAKDIYSKILKVSSKAYLAYYNMALLETDRENEYLKKAIAINPDFKDGWIDLARVFIKKNKLDNALSCLGIAKYIDDSDYRYYYYFGLVLKEKGLFASANENFEQSLKLNPDYEPVKKELNI